MINLYLQEERDRYLQESFCVLGIQSTPAASGTGCAFLDNAPDYVFIKKTAMSTATDSIVRVSGASMEPLYHDGDLVYIQITNGVDSAVIKRVKNHKLYSLNKALPYGEKSEDDHVQILGKVIGIVAEDDMATDGDYLVKNYSSVRWPNSNEQTVSNIKERDRKWKSTPVMPATTASLPMSNQSVVQTAER